MVKHTLSTEVEGHVAILTLDHPPRNTINTDILRDTLFEQRAITFED